ncbi:MAG: DUF4249 domain-containing protein, partial [Prevotella sp.]
MKYFPYYIIVLLLMFTSCKDDVELDSINSPAKLVVYCLPTEGDSCLINVSASVPVVKYSSSANLRHIDNANIDYRVNGTPLNVESLGNGCYMVRGRQKAGDKVSISVAADGYTAVSASTTIPTAVDVRDIEVRPVKIYDSEWEDFDDFNQVSATFTDDAGTHDYYAVRVMETIYSFYGTVTLKHSSHPRDLEYREYRSFASYREYMDYIDRYKDSLVDCSMEFTKNVSYLPINTKSEDLLQPTSDLDDDFGFSNDYYQDFYIFDDTSINGRTYKLHLNIDVNQLSYFNNTTYYVELYRLTPEYYRFIKSFNDVDNNDMKDIGISQIAPTRTDITNGIGLMGGWASARTKEILMFSEDEDINLD